MWSQDNWLSPTGANLAIRQMAAIKSKPTKGIIQINHGMAEHCQRYERFAKALSKAGYHTIAHDHRGHGFTKANDAPQGVFSSKDGLNKVIEDIYFINSKLRQQYTGVPIILFGHSMGTILGLNYCIDHSDTIEAAALWNSGVDSGALLFIYSSLLKIERALKGSDVPSTIAQKLTFEDWNKKFAPNRTEFDWLSRDNEEVDKYVDDPLCGFPVSIGLWLNILTAIKTAADNSQLAKIDNHLPMHLQAGAVDPCSDKGNAVHRLYDRLLNQGNKDVTFNLLADTRHESLNEINRDETTKGFIQWLDARFANK